MSTLNEFQAELDQAVLDSKLGEKLLARQVGVENNMLYLEIEAEDLDRVQAILDRAEAGDLNVLLLDKGTDGDTALNKALSVGNKEIVQAIFKKLFATSNLPILKDALLVNNDYGASPLHNLVLASDEIFQEVIELARDNNALEALLIPKAGESTALHFAAYEEMTGNIAKILKESGKVVGLQKSVLLAKNSDSVTPLYIAIETDKVEVVNAVMALTDVDILKEVFSYKSNTGDTVLHAANTRNVKEVKKAMYEKVLSHKDLLETLVIKDSFGATALNNLALAEKELFEEIFQTAKANNLLKDLLALEVDGANLLAMARDEADAASGAEKAKLDSVVSIIEIEMDVSPRTEEEKVLPDAKVITPIETMDIVHDTQLAAIESFANAHFKDVIVAEVHKPINTIKKAYDLAEATAVNADQQFKAYVVPTVTGPLKGKVKKQVQKINQQPKMDVQAQLQRAAGDADRQAKALKVELDNAKAFKAKLEAPFYLKTGIYLSQGADFIETAAYVSKKLGYEPSNGTSNAIYYGHDFLEILAGAAMLKGGGGISSVVGSIGQTNVVNNLVSNYASNSVLVNGVTIAASGVVAGVIGGVPLAIVSVALPVLNLGLNKLIEYNKISSDNALVKVAQPILTLAPQIMGAYYNPYAVGKVVASINIIKTADELGALGLIYDQLPTWEVAKEFVLSHPFADAAVVTEAFSVLTFSLGKTAALTSFGVAAPWFFGIGAAFAATEVAYQKGAFGLIKNYTYDQLPTWEVATNTTGEFLGNHPVGSVGALSGVAAAVTKFVPAIAAKAGGASPYLAVLSAASIVGDAAYSYEAIPGAGIAAALVTVGGLLAYGPGLPVAAAVTAAAALGGLAEYGYETYVGDHSKVEKTISNASPKVWEFMKSHPAGSVGVGSGIVAAMTKYAPTIATKASFVSPYLAVFSGASVVGDTAYSYDAIPGASTGAILGTIGGLLAFGPAILPVATAATAVAALGGLVEYGYETYVGDHSKVEKALPGVIDFAKAHPVGSVGALSGVAAAMTKFVPAIAAKAGGASPYLAVLSAASIVGDAAYSYEAIPGAGIAAALVTVGGLLAYGPGLPVAAAVTAAAALGGLAEYGYETYVGDHSKVEKTIFNGFNIAKEFIVDHPAGVGGGVVEIASVLALKASYVTTGAVVMVGGAFALAYDLYNSAYNTLGGVFAGGASVSTLGAGIGGLIGTAAGFFGGGAGAIAGGAYGAKIGSVAGATLGAIGGGLAEYGNNNWYYQISDDAKFPILTSLKYSATDIFNKIKDLSDAEIRQSYNDLITKFYNDKYKGAAKKMHCQGDDISADMAKETSGLRSELKLIHYYASSMLGKAGINGGLLFQYKTLEPNYNGEKSDEDIFYSSLKTDGGYLGLSGNGYGKVVDLSKKIRKADAATEKMKTAYPESITEEAVACMVNQYASNSTAVMVDVFGVCVDQFNFDCPTA